MTQLNEKQLRPEILTDLVEPAVDIDMYTPKIQQDSVVVVFRVRQSYDAAYDLSSFIEKLPNGILDTEAQEIPNAEGNYEVFCEFERDTNFPKNLVRVIKDIEKLGNEQEWQGNYYDADAALPIDEETVTKHVRLIPAKAIKEFLEYSQAKVLTEDRNIVLKSHTHHHTMVFSNVKEISEPVACALMREGWEYMPAFGEAIFGQQYSSVRTKCGIIVDRNGQHLLFM